MIDIDKLTIAEARQIASMFPCAPTLSTATAISDAHWRIGKNYFIRTVTHHHTGRLAAVTDKELVLENAAWIADDGRFTNSLAKCEFNEVEMFPANARVIIGRGSLIDAVEITDIPQSQK